MNFRTVRVNADLDRVNAEIAKSGRLALTDQHGVSLELHAKHQTPRVFEKVEEILAQKNFAAAEGQNKNAGVGHFIEQVLDFRGRHLAMIVMIEIAVHATLIAAVGQ